MNNFGLPAKKVLLLHPEDAVPARNEHGWDLIVDIGRAPESTYAEWSSRAGCRVMSLFDLSRGTDDLYRTRELLEFGMNEVVDRFGIDWWDVLVQSVVPQIQQLTLLCRLSTMLAAGADVYCTRPHFLATALHSCGQGRFEVLQKTRGLSESVRHYLNAVQKLDQAQLKQVLQDKFDPLHAIRRRFSRRTRGSGPVVLLPSAYVNVSSTAISYAAMLPDVNFLLVHARKNGAMRAVPGNVRQYSLDGYFSAVDANEQATLRNDFRSLRKNLASSAREFEMAEASGLLASLEARLSWGLAVRDAWLSVFDCETVTACICADGSNPYSRLPLIIAKERGIPALACHHGALDSRMAIKKSHADFYLAKSEMERDYLARLCKMYKEQIVTGGPTYRTNIDVSSSSPEWLVFFTEPYHALGWRTEEVYRELLPKLVRLAQDCGLELVFKLHPFESVAGHKKMLRRFLERKAAEKIRVIAGPLSAELWKHTRCGITVQSTVALECSSRAIPIFICGWLADRSAGYVQQYQRFGIGHVLDSPEEFDQVPRCLESTGIQSPKWKAEPLDPDIFRQLLRSAYSRTALATA